MAQNSLNFRQWDVDAVSKWLESIHLHSLIPNFERYNVSGADLAQLDDSFLRERLRITKPAEIAALKGAISSLVDQAQLPRPVNKGPNRKVSNSPRYVERERTGSFEKPKTYPHAARKGANISPTTMPRNYTIATSEPGTREPRLKKGASAPDVLDDQCRYSGWIRKQGGGYKNWKKRYLVLRMGCLYYFENENAKEAKGLFTLTGYQTEICANPEILKKFKWALKIEPVNAALRTYFIAVGAKRELYAWKQVIDEEIAACARRPRPGDRPLGPQPSGYTVGEVGVEVVGDGGEGSSDEEGDDEEPIYDQPDEGDDEFNEEGESPIYDRPDDGEEDDPYSEIPEGVRLSSPSTLSPPSHTGKGGPLAVLSYKSPDDWELAPEHRLLGVGKGGAPSVPMRSPVSLGLNQKPAPPPVRTTEDMGEDTYLPIIGSGPSESTPLTDKTTKLTSPLHHPAAIAEVEPELFDRDYEDDAELDGDDMYADDSDAYYIMIRKPEELMPPSCLFDSLDRADADRLLRAKGRDGTYLIRAGVHAGAEKVLSVWHIDRCRHYKLFKDDKSRYSLTQGQTFGTIPELLQYYTLSAHLPRSDFYLSEPFYPQDH